MSDILERARAAISYEIFYDHDEVELVRLLIAEVERLQDFRSRIARMLGQSPSDCDDLLILGLGARIIRNKRQATRIEELEAIRGQFYRHINRERGRVRFAFNQSQELILARARIKELEAEKERLEAAFLDHLAARLYYEHYPGVSDAYSWHDYPEDACHSMPKEEFRKKAREALEKIRSGKDEL